MNRSLCILSVDVNLFYALLCLHKTVAASVS